VRTALLTALLLAPGIAHAHLGHVVTRAERYLKVEASPEGVRIVVSLTLGPGEMARVMAAADADRDGTVTPGEADAYMAQWGEGLRTDLPVRIDGESVRVEWKEPFFDPTGPVQAMPGNVEMVARIATSGGRHRVRIEDRMRVESFDRTDVAFRVRDGATLVASGPGDAPVSVLPALAYGREGAPSALTADFELPGDPPGALPWAWIAGGAALLLVVASWLWLRGRRHPTPRDASGDGR